MHVMWAVKKDQSCRDAPDGHEGKQMAHGMHVTQIVLLVAHMGRRGLPGGMADIVQGSKGHAWMRTGK
jgi:hypothetical protein